MAYKKQLIPESLVCRIVLCLFDIAILASGLLSEAKKEAIYQETAMRMPATMSFAAAHDEKVG